MFIALQYSGKRIDVLSANKWRKEINSEKTLNKHVYTLILEDIFISEAELSIKLNL